MAISSVWLQLFDQNGAVDPNETGNTREIVEALKHAQINPVGWGYCHHANSATDCALASELCGRYGITAFVADMEPGGAIGGVVDNWEKAAFVGLVQNLSAKFGKDNLVLSTFPRLDKQPDAGALMPLVADKVAAFAPKIYWAFDDALTFIDAALASWQKAGIQTPILALAESYWDVSDWSQHKTPPRTIIEDSVAKFVDGLPNSAWSRLVGLSWHHAGITYPVEFKGAMSDAMIAKISAAKINTKPFKQV
jgi:hypothetical protein